MTTYGVNTGHYTTFKACINGVYSVFNDTTSEMVAVMT